MIPGSGRRLGWGSGAGIRKRRASRPFLVEVVGVAGAGKSTLTRLLTEGADNYRPAEFIHTRRPLHLLRVVHSLPRLSPILMANLVRRPRLSWADFKLMVYVTEWRRFLYWKSDYSDGVTLLDQGPMYALVRLRARGSGVASSRSFQRWLKNMTALWAASLAVVVWLDATDNVLQARIDERVQGHALKGEKTEISREFITQYRLLFEEILRDLDLPGGPEILRLDTTEAPPDMLVAEVRSALARSASSS